MKLLLDTHAFLWRLIDSPELSETANLLIDDPDNEVFVSAASAWEMATKYRLGKFPQARQAVEGFAMSVEVIRAVEVAMTAQHALLAGGFEMVHGDPFDRMLAAQAVLEGAALITRDSALTEFPVEIRW